MSEIDDILSRPGADWTDAEKKKVVEWLWREPQIGQIKAVVRQTVHGIDEQTVGGILSRFNHRTHKRTGKDLSKLDEVMTQYDPEKGDFLSFVKIRLKWFCKDEYPSNITVPLDDFDFKDPSPSIEANLIDEELNARLVQAIRTLPDKYREVILLTYSYELSDAEIAKIANTTEGNIRVRRYRALQMLSELLKNDDEHPEDDDNLADDSMDGNIIADKDK